MAETLQLDTASLEHLFEHSPWVVQRALALGPFETADEVHRAMMQVVQDASLNEQLALIRAHPELAAKVALTEASSTEQEDAGLKALNDAEFKRFAALNKKYRETFGFPFIICVRMHSKASILAAFEKRLGNDQDTERTAAIVEIGHITKLRLKDLFS
ncbi:MAG: OHCU decarboxylase [Acidocella sp. 20-61-6]|nr:MAG: OHCU decarboxylase [Acidocella sp. 20-61-6]